MADTNFDRVDTSDGYAVDGTEVIDGSGVWKGDIDAPAGSIGATELATDAVETIKIKDANVTAAKLAVNSVETAKIVDGSVTNAKLGVPKLVTYQESFLFSDMTDGGAASGTFDLNTSIPEGAVFVQSFIDAVTGFAGDTSAVITIGDGTDVDRYNTGTPDVFSTADHISAGAPSGTTYHSASKTPTITITSATDFTSVSAGQVTITLMYYQSV